MDTFPAKKKPLPIRLIYALYPLVNVGIAFWYLLASAWVLGEIPVEIHGTPYEWPLRVRLVSLLVGVVGLAIIISTIRSRHSKWYGRLLVACIATLTLLELMESIARGQHYGWGLTVVQAPALLLVWAIISALYFRRREA
jgi:hypothetical protein